MSPDISQLITAPFTKGLLMLLISFGVTGLLVGVWILIWAESFLRVNRFFSQWYSTRKATKALMVPRRTERIVYRHHRPIGLAIIFGSVYVLFVLITEYDRVKVIAKLFDSTYPTMDWLAPGLAIALGVCTLFALVIGGFLLVRPSLLKGFEAWANRWVSARRVTKAMDTMHEGPDRLLARRPRLVAGLLILGSLYVLFRLSVFIR